MRSGGVRMGPAGPAAYGWDMRILLTSPVLVLLLGMPCSTVDDDGAPGAPGVGEGEGEEGEGEEGEGEGEEGEGEEGEGEEGEGEGEGEGVVDVCSGVVEGCVVDGDDLSCTLTHDGRTRRYVLRVPPTGGAQAPVVLAFHGLNTTPAIQEYVSSMSADADARGYVLVYPEGIGMSFNAGACCGDANSDDIDDVGFSLAVLARLERDLCIDPARVYVTGLSNGGHMAYRFACEQADVVAGVASVAGIITSLPCRPSRPVSVLHLHGTADSIVRYDFGIAGLGAEGSVATFVDDNGCDDAPVVSVNGDVSCAAYAGCDAGTHVELCTVDGGGHQWFGGNAIPFLGENTDDIVATTKIADFFRL
jgi:polyhydroxybutyrate depolymerase